MRLPFMSRMSRISGMPAAVVELGVGDEVLVAGEERDVAIAAAGQRLRQRIMDLAAHGRVHERAHAAERDTSTRRSESRTRSATKRRRRFRRAAGASCRRTSETVGRGFVVGYARHDGRRHHGLLVDQDDMRRFLVRPQAAGMVKAGPMPLPPGAASINCPRHSVSAASDIDEKNVESVRSSQYCWVWLRSPL